MSWRTFPGPALGAAGFRSHVRLEAGRPAFGTILKPTAGLVPTQERDLVADIAAVLPPLLREGGREPGSQLPYCPLAERTRLAIEAIERQRPGRSETLLFAPHVTAAPGELIANVDTARGTWVMFSESWVLGGVRMVRDHLAASGEPVAIYGNAGVGVRMRAIWREVVDLLARLDGIDFLRRLHPGRPANPSCDRPARSGWVRRRSGYRAAGRKLLDDDLVGQAALHQGNIGLNLRDAEDRGILDQVLFLAGSAINSIKGSSGRPDPRLGAEAMVEALDVHRTGALAEVPGDRPRAGADGRGTGPAPRCPRAGPRAALSLPALTWPSCPRLSARNARSAEPRQAPDGGVAPAGYANPLGPTRFDHRSSFARLLRTTWPLSSADREHARRVVKGVILDGLVRAVQAEPAVDAEGGALIDEELAGELAVDVPERNLLLVMPVDEGDGHGRAA